VCEQIVVPNLRLREDLEEMFEMNWLEYVRRDTEGSDNDTRRRAACELVRGLTDKFPAEVRALPWAYPDPTPKAVAHPSLKPYLKPVAPCECALRSLAWRWTWPTRLLGRRDEGRMRASGCDAVPTDEGRVSALQVTRLFTGYVGAMLRDYAANPAGAWKSKDCAIYLVVALAVRRFAGPTLLARPCYTARVLEARSY